MDHPPLLFYAYASPDERFARELEKHLSSMEKQALIRSWSERMIRAGENRNEVIRQKLDEAKYILFLVSADFFAECEDLIPLALQQYADKGATIIPVIVRVVDWKHSQFKDLEPCPRNGKAVKSWLDQDEAWVNVVDRIREVIENGSAAKPPGSAGTAPPPPSTKELDRNDLLDALNKLLPAQFDEVLFLLKTPYAHLTTEGPRARTAIELIRLVEQARDGQGLQRLAAAIRKSAPALAL